MADKTKIEWTDATWNPITGCSIVSPGCTNCYAMRLSGTRLKHVPSRVGLTKESKAGPVWNGTVLFNEPALLQPLKWKRPRMIFVCAHGDLFAENVPDEWIDKVFAVMAVARQHTFQVLTKRPERMREFLAQNRFYEIHDAAARLCAETDAGDPWKSREDGIPRYKTKYGPSRIFPLHNVWLGVSVEDHKRANERVPVLLDTPAAIRFVSAEPLLGPIDLRAGLMLSETNEPLYSFPPVDHLDWVIVGGESGPGARPIHPDWARSLRDQCAAADVPFFFKQWGNWLPWEPEQGPCWKAQNGGCEDAHNLFPVDMDQDQKWDDGLSFVSEGSDHCAFQNVGKKAAGRLLDGVEHNAMPAIDRRAA